MTPTDLSLLILDLAADDFVGLWEIEWRAQSVEGAGDAAVDRAALRAVATRLLDDGDIVLFHGAYFNGDEARVDTAQARAVLGDVSAWMPAPRGDLHFRICATAKGESEYKRRFESA